MERMNTVHLVYFSGTGGTARVAAALEQAFLGRGLTVTTTELNAKPHPPVEADLTVLAYPVYAANAPAPVDEWIERAPSGNGMAAAVVSVSGGGEVTPNTACRVDVVRRLARKGYRVVAEDMFVMPANVFVSYSDVLSAMLLKAAPVRAERFADGILSGAGKRLKPHLSDRLFAKLFSVEKRKSGVFGRKLKAGDGCTGCAWCASNCPRGNIEMRDGKPCFGDRCVICLRCVYGCPSKAIRPDVARFFLLKQGLDLDAVEARTRGMTEFPPASEVAKGLLYKGVRRYLEELQ
jgi:ferredoxin/flavodoxin